MHPQFPGRFLKNYNNNQNNFNYNKQTQTNKQTNKQIKTDLDAVSLHLSDYSGQRWPGLGVDSFVGLPKRMSPVDAALEARKLQAGIRSAERWRRRPIADPAIWEGRGEGGMEVKERRNAERNGRIDETKLATSVSRE